MKPQIGFFSKLLGPSLIINLAQLVPPSVALPAEHIFVCSLEHFTSPPLDTSPGYLISLYRKNWWVA